MPPETAILVESTIGEEMGWGDAGLGVSLACVTFPLEMAKAVGNPELVDLCHHKIGCWMSTQPNKGSDVQILDMAREAGGNVGFAATIQVQSAAAARLAAGDLCMAVSGTALTRLVAHEN